MLINHTRKPCCGNTDWDNSFSALIRHNKHPAAHAKAETSVGPPADLAPGALLTAVHVLSLYEAGP